MTTLPWGLPAKVPLMGPALVLFRMVKEAPTGRLGAAVMARSPWRATSPETLSWSYPSPGFVLLRRTLRRALLCRSRLVFITVTPWTASVPLLMVTGLVWVLSCPATVSTVLTVLPSTRFWETEVEKLSEVG